MGSRYNAVCMQRNKLEPECDVNIVAVTKVKDLMIVNLIVKLEIVKPELTFQFCAQTPKIRP